MKKLIRKNKGFTLIEILVVIGIIAVLATIVLIAINPALHFAQARNTQREANVDTILNAIGQNMVANKGVVTGCPAIPITSTILGTLVTAPATAVDLTSCLADYLTSGIPLDPSTGTATDTGYKINQTAVNSGRFQVCAPGHAEGAIPLSATYCITR